MRTLIADPFLDSKDMAEALRFWAGHWGQYGYDSAVAYVHARGGVKATALYAASLSTSERPAAVEPVAMFLAALTPVQSADFRSVYLAARRALDAVDRGGRARDAFDAYLTELSQ